MGSGSSAPDGPARLRSATGDLRLRGCVRLAWPLAVPTDQAPCRPAGAQTAAHALGLRWGEVAGLRVGDLDLLKGALRVSEQRPAHGPPGPPKSSAGRRWLSLPAALVDMLAAHLSESGLTGADTHHLVFTSPDGQPTDYSNWRRRIWLPAVEAAGVVGAGFHDLRRTNATQLVVGGVDVKTVQTRLGHADPRLTLAVYAQAVHDADRVAAARLDERFFGHPDPTCPGSPAAKHIKE
jgi:integrase